MRELHPLVAAFDIHRSRLTRFYFSGNTAYGLMDQAERFVTKMLTHPQYDFYDSWKVLTLFIGGNDLCSCCRWWKNYREKYKPKNFISGNNTSDICDNKFVAYGQCF